MPIRIAMLAAVLLLCPPAQSQQTSPVVQGAFTASVGPATYRGKWSARISTRSPNTAVGSWILLNEQNDIVLQGTWSAQKSGTGWRGSWRARVYRRRAYSGNWTATEPGPGNRTFAEMLQAATQGSAAGTWTSGGFGGEWRLRPTP